MLDFNQIKNGGFLLTNEAFDPNEVLKLVCNIFAPQVEAQQIRIFFSVFTSLQLAHGSESEDPPRLHVADGKLPMLIGDKRRLQQVLINLVKNATKFTSQGHIKIMASYHQDEENLVMQVEDTGVGIAKEDMRKLFTRFGKLKRTAAMNSEGLGLGLTIVKQIVESAGG